MQLNEFLAPTRPPAAKFENVGDVVSGVIAQEPQLLDDKFNPGRRVLQLDLETDDGETTALFARGQMAEAIGQAVLHVGVEGIERGGHVRVTYHADKPLKSGRTMKVYAASYVPPEPMGTAQIGESDPWSGEPVRN